MKTTLSTPAPEKTKRKTPDRCKKPAEEIAGDTPTRPIDMKHNTAWAQELRRAAEITPPLIATTPQPAPTVPLPSLSATFGAPLKIIFKDLGNKEVVSDVPGGYTLAKRLAMAYAIASRTASSYTGVTCGDLASAFTVISFDPKNLCVTACLVTGTPTVELPWADPKFAAPDSSRVRMVAPERSAISSICYSDLPRVSTAGDCPHCGEYVSRRDFIIRQTYDAGDRLVAQCSFCKTMMKRRL